MWFERVRIYLIFCAGTHSDDGALNHFRLCIFRNDNAALGLRDGFGTLHQDTIQKWNNAFDGSRLKLES